MTEQVMRERFDRQDRMLTRAIQAVAVAAVFLVGVLVGRVTS